MEIKPLICFNLLEGSRDCTVSTCFSACFQKLFIGENMQTLLALIISSPVRYSNLSFFFSDDNSYIFGASLLISYCNFSSLILSIAMISFYILSKRFFLKRKRLSDARVT